MIDLDQVLYADRHAFFERISKGRIHATLSALRSLLYTRFLFPDRAEKEFIFFRSLARNDYHDFFNNVTSTVPEANRITIQDYIRQSKYPLPQAIFSLIKYLPTFFSFSADSIQQRFFLYFRLCFYYQQISALKKFEFNTIILFADMQPIENLISQYFGSKGKSTVTLQHGLYVDYEDFETVNRINYLHQPSEYFLSWGNVTKKLIQKYHPNRNVVLCGKPIVIHSSNIKSPPLDESFFTVILDQKLFDKQNKEMLHLMAEYSSKSGLKINVRFHPSNNKNYFRQLGIDFLEDCHLESSRFVVGHTSSMIYELLYCGIPTFKFSSEIPFVDLPDEIVFSNCTDIDNILNKKIDFKEIGKQYIDSTGEESMQAYTEFFSHFTGDICT